MVATVHDELVFDVPAATAEESKRIIVEEMTAAFVEMFGTEIPVEVEAKVCANWGACMINVVHATRGEAGGP